MPPRTESGSSSDGPHDVLAAEEFALPTVDPGLRRRPVRLPDDPTGIAEPHDVLAAEEFAMPAGNSRPAAYGLRSGSGRSRALGLAGMLVGLALLVWLLRRR